MKKQQSTPPVSESDQRELDRLQAAVAYQERRGNGDTLYHRQLADLLKRLGGNEEINDGELE